MLLAGFLDIVPRALEAFGRISHPFLREVDTDAALGHGFGVPFVVQRRSCSPFWCRGRFLAQFALGNLVHFPLRSCIWRHVFGVWVLFSVFRALDSSGDDLVYGRNAWFDSGYIFCVSIGLALGRIPRFST